MEGGSNKLRDFVKQVTLIMLSSCILLLYPILFLILFPLRIHRYVATKLAEKDPSLGNILSGLSGQYAAHKTYSKPTSVLIPYFIFTDRVDIHHINKVFDENIFKDNRGKCVFPEMQQRVVLKYGYHFWQNVYSFRIENHIRFLNPENPNAILKKSELSQVLAKLGALPFNPCFSPWEGLVIPNFVDENDSSAKSLFIFRLHHCLCDGYSILNIIQRLGTKPWKDFSATIKPLKMGFVASALRFLELTFTAPYHLLKLIYFSSDDNEWARNAMNSDGKLYLRETELLSLQDVKKIKEHYKVNLTSVCITLTALVTKLAMEKKNVHPSKIHMTMPFPLPGRPQGLCNHWTVMKVPISLDRGDPIKTLKYVDTQYNWYKSSIAPLVGWSIIQLVGNLPVILIPESDDLITATSILTVFPIASSAVDLFGYGCRMIGLGGSQVNGYAILTACLSYNGSIQFTIGGDTCNIKSQEDADEMAESIIDVLQAFKLHIAKDD